MRQLRRQTRLGPTAALKDVVGVLVVSAIPFAALQALAESDLGSRLQVLHLRPCLARGTSRACRSPPVVQMASGRRLRSQHLEPKESLSHTVAVMSCAVLSITSAVASRGYSSRLLGIAAVARIDAHAAVPVTSLSMSHQRLYNWCVVPVGLPHQLANHSNHTSVGT